MEYLEVYWRCCCEDYEKRGYKEWKNEIQISADFHGWGVWADDPESPFDNGQRGGFAIEFTPLAELKHYPLKIRNKTKIYLDDGGLESKILFEGEKYFSVFDFISAILYEISWGGSPELRDEKMAEVLVEKEEIDERIESGDTSCFKNFDELKRELTEEE